MTKPKGRPAREGRPEDHSYDGYTTSIGHGAVIAGAGLFLPPAIEGPVVYRAYDQRGTLLYVGFSRRVAARAAQHRKESLAWWSCCASWTVTTYASEAAARAAEKRAIRELEPVFNKLFNPAYARLNGGAPSWAPVPVTGAALWAASRCR